MEERDLLFSEYPMFDYVMEHRTDLCRRVLETVLGEPVEEVANVIAERSLQPRIGSHGVRFDAIVRTTGKIYDVEMQTYSRKGIGRRMRYYQSAIDTAMLPPGADYERLPECYVVFICLEDEFRRGCPIYTFDMVCREDPDVALRHGFAWVVLYASAWQELPESPLRGLLRYVATGETGGDGLAVDLASAVAEANTQTAWKKEALAMLTLEEDMRVQARLMQEEAREEGLEEGRAVGLALGHAEGLAQGLAEGRAEGHAEGRAKGAEEMGSLVALLLDADRIDDARRAAADAEYRAQLLQEFGIR